MAIEDDISDLERNLKMVMAYTKVTPDGRVVETRQLVDRMDNIKFEIYPKEHSPPHFHVNTSTFSASFRIIDGEQIEGFLKSKDLKKVKYFHKNNRQKLIQVWNELRPTDCPVGPIED